MAVPLPATRQVATSDSPVVVERTLTFSNQGYGLTMSAGSNTPATRWIFAEDTTANHFQTFLTILNPNTVPTQVTACFYGQGGDSPGNRTPVAPGLSRANLKFNDFLSASGIASVVTGNLPVAVERSHRPCAYINVNTFIPGFNATHGAVLQSVSGLWFRGRTDGVRAKLQLAAEHAGPRSVGAGLPASSLLRTGEPLRSRASCPRSRWAPKPARFRPWLFTICHKMSRYLLRSIAILVISES